MKNIVELINATPRMGKPFFSAPVNLAIARGEQLAIVGGNGSGKRVLVEMIAGIEPLKGDSIKYNFKTTSGWVCDNIKHIAFRDSYGVSDKDYYYQQRWNSSDTEGQTKVKDVLPKAKDEALRVILFDLFKIDSMLEKELILLSSGEMRKLQLTKALLTAPEMLILESPFIGLDAGTRAQLQSLLFDITQKTDLQVILVLSKSDEVPDFVTHVIEIENRICSKKQTLAEYQSSRQADPTRVLSEQNWSLIRNLAYAESATESQTVVDINNISIRYGEYTILKDVTWRIGRGEKWSLSGVNGAGKSTLLSLICADNPQGYACDITLFGMRRGVGASIWDIKKHIGYVSPEMHRSYMSSAPCIEIVASGLHDTIGLYKKMRESDVAVCEFWMNIFGISDLAERSFMRISSGEQRLVLLARAFVKDPELLILDEPLHGLDMHNRRLALDVIEAFCEREGKSVIFVTHYLNELPGCINKSYVLKKNR